MSSSPVVADILQLSHGVAQNERQHVVAALARLDDRFRSFPDGAIELSLSVKERDTPSQRTTLEARIAGQHRVVATSVRTDLDAALSEVRDEMVRQITDAKNRTEPGNNRAGRETLRRASRQSDGRPLQEG